MPENALTQASLGEALFEIGGEEFVEHVVDLTLDEGFQAVEGEVDAVIRDAILGEIVGAYLFLTTAAAEEVAAVSGVLGGLFLLLPLQQT